MVHKDTDATPETKPGFVTEMFPLHIKQAEYPNPGCLKPQHMTRQACLGEGRTRELGGRFLRNLARTPPMLPCARVTCAPATHGSTWDTTKGRPGVIPTEWLSRRGTCMCLIQVLFHVKGRTAKGPLPWTHAGTGRTLRAEVLSHGLYQHHWGLPLECSHMETTCSHWEPEGPSQ